MRLDSRSCRGLHKGCPDCGCGCGPMDTHRRVRAECGILHIAWLALNAEYHAYVMWHSHVQARLPNYGPSSSPFSLCHSCFPSVATVCSSCITFGALDFDFGTSKPIWQSVARTAVLFVVACSCSCSCPASPSLLSGCGWLKALVAFAYFIVF